MLSQPFYLGLLCLFLLTAATVLSVVPAIISVDGNVFGFVLQTPTDNVFRLSITTNDIIYNPQDQMIYTSRPSTAGDEGNAISRINPLTGEIGPSVYVGSEPNKLALSDNGQSLYVSLDGAYAIRRYEVSTQTPGLQFPIGREGTSSEPLGAPFLPRDMAVVPGNPDLLAVARQLPGISPGGNGVAIYNNGVRLPNIGPGHSETPVSLAFSHSASTLYGGTYDAGLRKLNVNVNGVTDVTGTPTYSATYIKFQSGLVFTSNGRIIDTQTNTVRGTCAGVNTSAFVPDTATGRVLYAIREGSTQNVVIKACDINTFIYVGSLTIPNVGNDFIPTTLLRYGTNGLVLRTSNNQIYFVQTSLLPTENPLPTPTGTPVTTPTPTPSVYATFVRPVTLPNRDLIYNRSEQKFYASVPSTAASPLANTVTRIDPETGALENSVVVGDNPVRLGLSDDDRTLYVGINSAYAVRKFDLQTQTPGLQFPLGTGVNGPKTANDIEVLPGDPNAVAVSYGNIGYNYDGVDIYDEGVKRAQKANASGSITMESSETLYVGENWLYKYAISQNGLTLQGNALTTNSYRESELHDGLLYTSGGGVIDLATGNFKGSFRGVGSSSIVTIDQPNNRAFFLSQSIPGSEWSIKAYRLDNFLPVGSITFPGLVLSPDQRRLFRWGENGLAFTDYNNKIYFVQSDLVSTNGAIPTALQLSSQVLSASETAVTFPVTIARSGGVTGTSTIDYATVDGTAIAGADYTASSGTITFAPGESSKTINIPIVNDTIFEGNETFGFALSNPGGDGRVELFEPSSAVLTILDNDGQPSISAANISVNEPLTGMTAATFSVQLSNPTTQTVTVNYATVNGTATADSDYVPTSGTLTFAPLETTKTIEVQVLADQNSESNETFRINFTNAVNAWINTFQATGTIFDYNPNPTPTPTPTPIATPTPTPAPVFVRRVNLPVNDFVYSPSANSFFASVPSSAGVGRGNTLTKINPANGEIGTSVFVGSEPNRMAVSDDGQTIYVKLDGAKSVRRFDVPTQTAGLQFALLGQFLYVEDWAVQPGNPHVLAVSSFDGVAIYDHGVQRPVIADGGAYSINTIAFSGPTTLYGWDDYTSGADLVRFTVTDSGVDGTRVRSGVQGLGDEIEYSNGLLYGSYGRVVDLGGSVVGTFQGGGGLMALDPTAGRIFFLNGNTLTAYNINSFAKIGATTIPGLTGSTGRLVRWGDNGLAVRANNQLYLIQSPLISPNGDVPTGIQLSLPTYNTFETSTNLQVTVTRNGDLSETSTVDYTTESGTATSGADFAPTAGTIVFTPGETSKTITIPLINDNVFEGSESFNIVLSNPGGSGTAAISYPNTGMITIFDNDNQPSVSTPNVSFNEPRSTEGGTALFVVHLTNPTTQTATVDFSTADGTAKAGSDYEATSGRLTFAPLETTKIIAVHIMGDEDSDEPDETFKINLSNGQNVSVNNSFGAVTIVNYASPERPRVKFDFDADGRSDISVYRPSDSTWYINRSSAGYTLRGYGEATDKLTPADFDGDGKTDMAVWRPSDGNWYIIYSTTGAFVVRNFGVDGDIPVPGDFDGDGKADYGIYRPSEGRWYRLLSSNQYTVSQFGIAEDKPQIGDFDADQKADLVVYRPSTGEWYVAPSGGGYFVLRWGVAGDIPVPGDYNGDGKTDCAIFRPSTGEWWVLFTGTFGYTTITWGVNGDIPAPGDYDGDGKTDYVIFRPSTQTWWLYKSTEGIATSNFGQDGDRPLANSFVN